MPGSFETPTIRRRLACFVYEGVLLFGVLVLVGWVYGLLTGQRHALQGRAGLELLAFFVVPGVYFVWQWSRGGQTLPMKTWQVRVVDADGRPPSIGRAALRYLLSWLWFGPGLVALALAGLHRGGEIAGVLAANVLGVALLARLHPQRQFLHDLLAGTRLVRASPAPKAAGQNPGR